ncbi:MAG: class I SAM-dependent methyltransferase [Thermoplasmata archaeon]|jgi:SAM-dependent methyltransferase|nr:class I SAM-dependent methyltransferase [Thermoplasmata archaeon]
MGKARDAWQRLYSRHGLQYGGSGDIGPLAHVLRSDMLVLDAGCGDGKTTEILSRKCEVVGIDFSREALLTFRAQRLRENEANLVEGNVTQLPFDDEKFDSVSCVHTLSHMLERDRRTAALELSRVIKAGGYVFVEGFGRGDIRYGEGEETESASFLRGNGILTHYFSEGEISGLFPGLQVVSELAVQKRVSFGARAGRREIVRALMKRTG